MNKIDLYIVKRFVGTFVFMLLLILAVSIVIDIAEKIDDIFTKKPPIDLLITSYYKNFSLFYGNLLSPICIFLAVIYFTSRMTSNTEIVALLSGGVSFWRIMATYMVTAFMLAGLSFYANAYTVPIANGERIDFELKYLKKKVAMLDKNIHKKIGYDRSTGEETFVYLFKFDQYKNEGETFSMEVVVDKDIRKKTNAEKIIWLDETEQWSLRNVTIHTFDGDKERLIEMPRLDTTLLLSPDDIYVKEMAAESLPLDKLYASYELETQRESGLAEGYLKEIYKRYAYPFSAIILTLIGFSVSTKKRRGGTPLQIGIGLVIAFAYVLLVVTGDALGGDALPIWLKIWLPNIVFFLIALVMLRIAPK